MKVLYIICFSFKSNTPLKRYITFTCRAAFLPIILTCLSNLSFSSIVMPNNFTSFSLLFHFLLVSLPWSGLLYLNSINLFLGMLFYSFTSILQYVYDWINNLKSTCTGVPTHMMLSIVDMCWNGIQHHTITDNPYR